MRSGHHVGEGFPLQSNIIHITHKEVTMPQEVKSDVKLNLEGLALPYPDSQGEPGN